MQKLVLLLLLIFGFDLYSQESEYRLISENEIRTEYEKVIDTTGNTKLLMYWKTMTSDDKEKIRNRILEQKKDIESDTSNLTKIFYIGKREDVELKINGKTLYPTLSKAEYYSESISGDSIFKINLGTIPRYSNVQSAELILNDLRRKAKIQLDTKYSLLEIQVEHIEKLNEILKREKEVEENRKKLDQLGIKPEIPKTIEVMEREEVLILHRIPKRKHIW